MGLHFRTHWVLSSHVNGHRLQFTQCDIQSRPLKTYSLHMFRIREALKMGTSKAINIMPLPKKKKKKKPSDEEVEKAERQREADEAAAREAAKKPARTLRRELPESAGTGIHKDGRTLYYITPEGRSAWFCRYGWLVKDIVGIDPETMAANCRPRSLIANVLFLLHISILAGLFAGWAGSDGSVSTVQLGTALAIKALWTQYVLAIRPYASLWAVIAELIPSCLEVVVLIMALLQASHATMSTPPSTVCMMMLFAEVGFVSLVEAVRALLVVQHIFTSATAKKAAERQSKVQPLNVVRQRPRKTEPEGKRRSQP